MKLTERSTLYADFLRLKNVKDRKIYFLYNSSKKVELTYSEFYREVLSFLYFLQKEKKIKRGSKIVIAEEDNRILLTVFWASILGGYIPVPLSTGIRDDQRRKIVNVVNDLGTACWLFTNSENAAKLEGLSTDLNNKIGNEERVFYYLTSDIENNDLPELIPPEKTDIAYIQYSSGSTGTPKGVLLSHQNIIANTDAIRHSFQYKGDDKVLSWIPFTHDLGLIFIHITSLSICCDQFLMSTSYFIKRPLMWMQIASDYQITVTVAPNFGVHFFNQLFASHSNNGIGWNLSSLSRIGIAAEPISYEVCNTFLKSLAPYGLSSTCFIPGYGLAEASVAVTCSEPGKQLRELTLDRGILKVGEAIAIREKGDRGGVSFVCLGPALKDCQIRICDNSDTILPLGYLGHIQIKGDNVTSGYFNPESNLGLFSIDGWLKTGDLGFLTDEENLVMTGRSKNILILNGQNYYPHDIELTLCHRVDGLSLGKVVACGLAGNSELRDRLIVFVLYKAFAPTYSQMEKSIKNILSMEFGISECDVFPVKRIPKTTSGKIQHHLLLQDYLSKA